MTHRRRGGWVGLLPALAAGAVFTLQPQSCKAMGLGELHTGSLLAEPLSAWVPLSLDRGDSWNTDCELSLHRVSDLPVPRRARLQFQSREGRPGVRITTTRPEMEPVLEFELRMDCARANIALRDYLVLLDPAPGLMTRITAQLGRLPTRPLTKNTPLRRYAQKQKASSGPAVSTRGAPSPRHTMVLGKVPVGGPPRASREPPSPPPRPRGGWLRILPAQPTPAEIHLKMAWGLDEVHLASALSSPEPGPEAEPVDRPPLEAAKEYAATPPPDTVARAAVDARERDGLIRRLEAAMQQQEALQARVRQLELDLTSKNVTPVRAPPPEHPGGITLPWTWLVFPATALLFLSAGFYLLGRRSAGANGQEQVAAGLFQELEEPGHDSDAGHGAGGEPPLEVPEPRLVSRPVVPPPQPVPTREMEPEAMQPDETIILGTGGSESDNRQEPREPEEAAGIQGIGDAEFVAGLEDTTEPEELSINEIDFPLVLDLDLGSQDSSVDGHLDAAQGVGMADSKRILESIPASLLEVELHLLYEQNKEAAAILESLVSADKEAQPDIRPWFMLFELYRNQGDQEAFDALSARFRRRYNILPPDWQLKRGGDTSGGLEARFPRVVKRIAELWASPECVGLLNGLLLDKRGGERQGFELEVAQDISLLRDLLIHRA